MSQTQGDAATIFVTGASGYVGGRLVPRLLAAGYSVRCLAREPRKLVERSWRHHPNVRVLQGDMSDVDRLVDQLRGCSAAYYLVHSMEAVGDEYAAHDRLLATNFAAAVARAGVGRIIYLGGLGELGEGLSRHLRSRREVEERLASAGVPVTTFRAAMIIGSGSASFEILRYLVERLPVMVTPSWVRTESQPVAIVDVLHWLVRCLAVPETVGKTLEIGGPDVLPYHELMRIMAEELRLPGRLIIPLPVLTPRLSSLWISLVTPVSYRIARPLAEGLRNRVVVTDGEAQRLMPHAALGVRDAIRRALQMIATQAVETRWSAAGPIAGDPDWAGGTVHTDRRSVVIRADAAAVFAAVCRIGGGHGWYAGDILWRIRGWMDTLAGGPGLRRGRRDPDRVEFGEALDFWRVVGLERNRSLSLLAEMKLPGQAMLNFDIEPSAPEGRTSLTMTARFRPRGLAGILYWYAVAPLHNVVFGGMLNGIRKTAEAMSRSGAPGHPGPPPEAPAAAGYGRARLWLGISAVGTLVTLCTLGLLADVAGMVQRRVDAGTLGSPAALLLFVLTYAAIQLPFDVAGGYLLPRRFGRSHPPLARYLADLSRGVFWHTGLLYLAALAILSAGRHGGFAGTVAAGLAMVLVLLGGRAAVASLMARLELTPGAATMASPSDKLPIYVAESADEGFTGAVLGLLGPRCHILPERWRALLGPEGFDVAIRRRSLAIQTGSWRRGRVMALLFTALGLTLAAGLTGPSRLGTAGGTIAFSFAFTLWSFAGLLVLPTFSRLGVIEVDERAQAEGLPAEAIRLTAQALDRLQDGEPDRPSLVEAVFHPIPSVRSRLEGPRTLGAVGFWDAARTSVYLSLAGLGLLGRAVHCNCGRPALWVFLPTD
ncbi:3 beta-hydroxysteroid dehydrogenase/Delta 5--_4-isomerase [Aquisphaera giovannonii]|uniref:3 beta-hydroxysteroid dehydrogenase/Delta 5-->4-isomerase n=1 Tax=Aquisphaera giovannonii TaxID=406548 RepID=A0A5B9W3N6_9BACT|nr:SDR family oxidoreductase [Aquisphaera giovannonii]QEH35233.1 3 beta-hydroxysteroid dehydrogenase/Delta 5-->4-isomerase [Aquisphaera giovannonii]